MVDESHLPAIGAAAMCIEVLTGQTVSPPPTRGVRPHPEWRDAVAGRWQQYRGEWSTVTGIAPPTRLDESAPTAPDGIVPGPAGAPPRIFSRSVSP